MSTVRCRIQRDVSTICVLRSIFALRSTLHRRVRYHAHKPLLHARLIFKEWSSMKPPHPPFSVAVKRPRSVLFERTSTQPSAAFGASVPSGAAPMSAARHQAEEMFRALISKPAAPAATIEVGAPEQSPNKGSVSTDAPTSSPAPPQLVEKTDEGARSRVARSTPKRASKRLKAVSTPEPKTSPKLEDWPATGRNWPIAENTNPSSSYQPDQASSEGRSGKWKAGERWKRRLRHLK
jgi:hypothetical protein